MVFDYVKGVGAEHFDDFLCCFRTDALDCSGCQIAENIGLIGREFFLEGFGSELPSVGLMVCPFAPDGDFIPFGEVRDDTGYHHGLTFSVFYFADGVSVFLVGENNRIYDTGNEVLIILLVVHTPPPFCSVYYIPIQVSSQA